MGRYKFVLTVHYVWRAVAIVNMDELVLTGISHGKHEFFLEYPKVDGVEICKAHCKCGYEVHINNYWNYGGIKDLQMKWEKHVGVWKGWG